MENIKFLHATGLNRNGLPLAELYLESGILHKAVAALGLGKADRLEVLVVELQGAWGSACADIKRAEGNQNEGSGEVNGVADTPETFMYGKEVADTDSLDGKTMIGAVKNMSIFVVDCAENEFLEETNDDQRKSHENLIIAMFVEAIWALQHDRKSCFRKTLLSESLKKVDAYVRHLQQDGESMIEFKLRVAKANLAECEDKKSKGDSNREHEIHRLTLESRRQEDVIKHMIEHQVFLPQRDSETDVQFELRTLQKDLAVAADKESEQNHKIAMLNFEIQHEKDMRETSEYKRIDSERKRERRDLEIVQRKHENLQIKSNSEQLKEENDSLEGMLELADLQLEDAEHKNKELASKVNRQTKKIKVEKSARCRVLFMGKNVVFKQKPAK